MIRAAGRAWAVAAVAAAYLSVLAAAGPHQIHHAGEPLRLHLAADDGSACPLGSALAWKGGDLPLLAPPGAPAELGGAAAPPEFSFPAPFDPASLPIRAPPRPAAS